MISARLCSVVFMLQHNNSFIRCLPQKRQLASKLGNGRDDRPGGSNALTVRRRLENARGTRTDPAEYDRDGMRPRSPAGHRGSLPQFRLIAQRRFERARPMPRGEFATASGKPLLFADLSGSADWINSRNVGRPGSPRCEFPRRAATWMPTRKPIHTREQACHPAPQPNRARHHRLRGDAADLSDDVGYVVAWIDDARRLVRQGEAAPARAAAERALRVLAGRQQPDVAAGRARCRRRGICRRRPARLALEQATQGLAVAQVSGDGRDARGCLPDPRRYPRRAAPVRYRRAVPRAGGQVRRAGRCGGSPAGDSRQPRA